MTGHHRALHIVVLGAGIAGLTAAHRLQRAGHRITVVDAGPPGGGASGGNGAQLSWSYVQPLADAGLWRQLPKLLLSPRSPLRIRPRFDPKQWHWALRFLAACNDARSRETTATLLVLAERSRLAFERLREVESIDCDFAASGKLVLYGDAAAFAGARRQLERQRAMGGAEQHAIDPAEARRIEPALAGLHGPFVGAIHTPSECAADCAKVCRELAARLTARGACLLTGTRAIGFMQDKRRAGAIRAVRLRTQADRTRDDTDELEADVFVIALGSGSARLAATLGIALPVYPLKGYSLTLDLGQAPAAARAAPHVSVTHSAHKTVFARLGDRLRVAGMAELVGENDRIPAARIRALREATAAVFPDCVAALGPLADAALAPWTGLRPATPTGVPVVGQHPRGPANLLMNTGHGALGFTLAFGTAERIADEVGALEMPTRSKAAAAAAAARRTVAKESAARRA